MSVAFTREKSAETAAEVELPDRPISPHPKTVRPRQFVFSHQAQTSSAIAITRASICAGSIRSSGKVLSDPEDRSRVGLNRTIVSATRDLKEVGAAAKRISNDKGVATVHLRLSEYAEAGT
jgi:hypothetical protein